MLYLLGSLSLSITVPSYMTKSYQSQFDCSAPGLLPPKKHSDRGHDISTLQPRSEVTTTPSLSVLASFQPF